ncbi:hypothetical protein [Oryzobacter telluris]|uniref:hypothetical protein n=1 Tax=Oryzobacter telluris TaxID=3149179 RepID=UPI00370D39FC
MRAVRGALGALGVAATVYGVLALLRLPFEQVVAVLVWVGGGIVGHDGILAPLVVALGVAAAVRLPDGARSPVLRAAVVLGPLTLVAVPVLGRFGAKADNPTLLDRPYLLGYGALVVVVLVASVVPAVRAHRSAAREPSPPPRA